MTMEIEQPPAVVITIFLSRFLLNISGGKCLEIISVENIKNEILRCMPVL